MHDERDYLLPYVGSFWRWRDRGDVIEWVDGPTIAFRGEVLAILRRLEPHGLPPFGSVVLLLAAMRDNWQELTAGPRIMTGMLGTLPNADGPFGVQARAVLGKVLGDLDRVSLVDAELRKPLVAKATICEIIFEGLEDRTSLRTAEAVVELLDHGLGEDDLGRRRIPRTRGHDELLGELRCLYLGLDHFDPATLQLRLQTGLDQVPEPAEVEVPPAQRVRLLLSQLRQDEELCGLAMLATHLMAAVTLPRSLADREELPIGGFSDIANRGSLDRLLLSELAHDDMTLAVRVAVNEALYLRRESPPKNPPCQRAVLLEAGIRSWGVPRVFATAVALALLATGGRHTQLQVYRAKRNRIQPVDLTTRAGLVEHLAALEPDLHPANALDAFQQAIAACDQAAEPVLVTTEDVADDREFRQALSGSEIVPLVMATVNRNGRFRLTERSRHGERCIRSGQLDLAHLFAERSQSAPRLIEREGMKDFPVILSIQPFPLRMSHSVERQRTWRVSERGVCSLTSDRRLMYWSTRNQGAIQIADNVPSGRLIWWSGRERSGCARAVIGHVRPGGLCLLRIDPEGLQYELCRLETVQAADVVFSHNGAMFALSRSGSKIDVLEESTGRLIETADLSPGTTWRCGRFFQGYRGACWYAASHDGRKLCFEPITNEKTPDQTKFIAMFERDGFDGPIGVTERGGLYLTATGQFQAVKHGLAGGVQVLAISSGGKRIALGQGNTGSTQCCVVDVETLAVASRYGDPHELVEPIEDLVHLVNLRNRFTHIGVDKRGILTLTSRRGVHMAIDYDSPTDRIRLRACGTVNQPAERRVAFGPTPAPRNVGYRLAVAAWDDGSRAFLDSRGLLHLKSADPRRVPETTLALNESEVSGWCGDGRMWGSSYFLGDHTSADKRSIFENAICAFARQLS